MSGTQDIQHGLALSLRADKHRGYSIKFEAPYLKKPDGPAYIKTHGKNPVVCVKELLAVAKARGSNWEFAVRATLAAVAEPWIEELAREHGNDIPKSQFLFTPGKDGKI